jgi:AraC-like DNA-binding protein
MDTGLGLVEVALRHGYADVSHMTRHFTAELGVPPGGFRRTMESLGQGLDSFKTEWTVSL